MSTKRIATADGGEVVEFTAEEETVRAAEEKAWADGTSAREFKLLRQERDKLLDETDWIVTMHKELETNIPTAWKTYRQELRDLPADTSDPANPTWPTIPE